jgi:DnaJ homolog subfamily A member 1
MKEGGGGGGFAFHDPRDIFEMFFGGGGRRGERGARRGKDVHHQLSVSLEELYNGATRKLALQKNVICKKCEGLGGKKGSVEKCGTCRGTGVQVHMRQLGPGIIQQMQTTCSACSGEGERIPEKDRCKECNGRKTIKEKKVLEVFIEKVRSPFINVPYSVRLVFTCSTLTGFIFTGYERWSADQIRGRG